MISIDALSARVADYRANLYAEAQTERLVAAARAGRPSFKVRLAHALVALALESRSGAMGVGRMGFE